MGLSQPTGTVQGEGDVAVSEPCVPPSARLRGEAGMHAPGSQAARLLHASPALCTAPRRSPGAIRPRIINSLSDLVLISKGKTCVCTAPGTTRLRAFWETPGWTTARWYAQPRQALLLPRQETGLHREHESAGKSASPSEMASGNRHAHTLPWGCSAIHTPTQIRPSAPCLHPEPGRGCARSEKPPCCSCRVKMPKSCPCASARGQICIPGLKNRSTISSPDPSVIKHGSE